MNPTHDRAPDATNTEGDKSGQAGDSIITRIPPRRPILDCPDCTSVANEENILTHDETCVIGRAHDQRRQLDREWFDAHPGADYYVRKMHRSEVFVRQAAGIATPSPDLWRTRVTRLGAGVRGLAFIAPVGGGSYDRS